MLDFRSKEINSKVLSRLTELINKSTKYLSILSLIYKIEVGSKLNLNKLILIG